MKTSSSSSICSRTRPQTNGIAPDLERMDHCGKFYTPNISHKTTSRLPMSCQSGNTNGTSINDNQVKRRTCSSVPVQRLRSAAKRYCSDFTGTERSRDLTTSCTLTATESEDGNLTEQEIEHHRGNQRRPDFMGDENQSRIEVRLS